MIDKDDDGAEAWPGEWPELEYTGQEGTWTWTWAGSKLPPHIQCPLCGAPATVEPLTGTTWIWKFQGTGNGLK